MKIKLTEADKNGYLIIFVAVAAVLAVLLVPR